jgi:hypothetical protein
MIKLKIVKKEDSKKVLNFEQSINSKIFPTYDNEDDVRKYIKESIVFFITLDNKEIGIISYKVRENNSLYFN